MKHETFFEKFDRFADGPDAVAKMQSAGTAGLRTRKENASAEPRDTGTEPRVPPLRTCSPPSWRN